MAWPIIIKKDVLYVFFCSIETSEISNGKQMKTAVGVYPLCIYTWHRCVPSLGGVRSVLSYIYLLGVGSIASYLCSHRSSEDLNWQGSCK